VTEELPLGGRVLVPRYRPAGWCGAPSAGTLGELDLGDLADKARDMVLGVAAYGDGRTVQPVMEPIAVVDHWLRVARENKALLLLNIQPGRRLRSHRR